MANILQNPSYQTRRGYNGFDMSKRVSFSSTVGELLPIYYDLLNAGDKVSIKTEIKSRTMELDSAAMMSITENIEWFFVPLTQIYKPFGSWFYAINDIDSSLIDPQSIGETLPYVAADELNHVVHQDFANAWTPLGVYVTDSFNYKISSIRLLDFLGVPASSTSADQTSNPLAYSPIFACAYQKIYSDYYRLSDREDNAPISYNLDRYYNQGQVAHYECGHFFKMRYRPWKRDFFTNLNISPIMGSASVNALPNQDLSRVNQWLINGPNSGQRYTAIDETGSANAQNPTTVASNYTYGQLFANPVNFRTMFAVEKLLEVTRRAGKHYDKQTLAHFGVDVPTGISGEVMFLGGSKSKILIGDVIASSSGPDNALGQVGGKGYGVGSSSDLKFTAPSHGILMGIYSAEPDVDYTNVMRDKLTTLIRREDFYIPAYDELGQQPLFMYQGINTRVEDTDPTEYTQILGWQWRYSELKMKFDTVFGALQTGKSLGFWKPQRYGFASNKLSSFLIDPTYLDNVMLVKYQPGDDPANCYNTDPLIHELFVDCKKSSRMSTYGIPSL